MCLSFPLPPDGTDYHWGTVNLSLSLSLCPLLKVLTLIGVVTFELWARLQYRRNMGNCRVLCFTVTWLITNSLCWQSSLMVFPRPNGPDGNVRKRKRHLLYDKLVELLRCGGQSSSLTISTGLPQTACLAACAILFIPMTGQEKQNSIAIYKFADTIVDLITWW